MKYIDKYQTAAAAHAINVEYLQDCYHGPGIPMIPPPDDPDRSFEDFKKREYRFGHDGNRGWQDLLWQEQDGLCCYCMRLVQPGKLTIEHVVPRALNGLRGRTEYALYAANARAIQDFVVMSDEFAQKMFPTAADIAKEERMPHITAEANLLIACNGKRDTPGSGCCCNNTRKDAYMLPIMLMEECIRRVDYDENGLLSILPIEASLKTIVQELNDETLKTVRRIWYRISGTKYSVEDVKKTTSYLDRVILLKTAFGVPDFELLPYSIKQYAGAADNPKQVFYWNLLLSYNWFYGFYRNRRAKATA